MIHLFYYSLYIMQKKIKTVYLHDHKIDIYKGTGKNKKYKAIIDNEKTL